ncbi:(2Fe-2S)-binding protein [Paraburkholderia sp. LEh10]|uniref:(2Fe-2S)-binding protein n=1 Tax=Paraburkholderia sp. LEh10 TaxID=2821353 RepID=UPI001AE93AF9|nr:(2Fe-2S)-binding protein [Paraburkholderia sp. LEh10]MBP0589260.1 (2Fe-2S)-binding protein [Paraburkholderia sp. LEh10]
MSDALRSRVRVVIDGEPVDIEQGATIAAALAICGASARGTRASVSNEPRAAFCGMGVCHECRVTVDGRAHVLACQTLCSDGQNIRTTRPR